MKVITTLILLVFPTLALLAQEPRVFSSLKTPFLLEEVAAGLTHPWSISWLPDGSMIYTERSGSLKMLRNGQVSPIVGLPAVLNAGQGGLLEVAVDPQYSQAAWIYISYSPVKNGQSWLEVARGKLNGSSLTNLEILWSQTPGSTARVHYGGRLAFHPDRSLLISTGDRGTGPRAQNLADGAGKIIRIQRDGKPAPDNPFQPAEAAFPVYSLGHRNIQGLAVHPLTGEVWATEHGARGGDELNQILPGKNYGWPVITLGVDYSGAKIGEGTAKPGMEQPVTWWTPSPAPSGLAWYFGESFPGWKGSLFSGNLAGQHLLRMEVESGRVVSQEKLLLGTIGRIRDVRSGPDGFLYLATDSPQGKIYRLRPLP